MMNHPSAAIATVPINTKTEDLNDFFTYCFMKKSESAAIDMTANPEILVIFSSPRPKRSTTMKNMTSIIASKQ